MAGEPPVDVGNISGFLRDIQQAGINATQGLAMLREAGGQIRDSRWFALYGQVADSVARSPEFLAINPYVLPDASQYGTFAMGRGGQYSTTVELQVLDRGTGLFLTQKASYITNAPHTGVEAEAGIMDQWTEFEHESDYGKTVLGGIATAYYVTVPYGEQ